MKGLLLGLSLLFAGCTASSFEVIGVAPNLAPCMDPFLPADTQCLQVQRPGNTSIYRVQEIKGFSFQPGYHYTLRVRIDRRPLFQPINSPRTRCSRSSRKPLPAIKEHRS